MKKISQELIEKMIRLRVEDRRSIREIQEITGVSKGSISHYLKDHPLSDHEKKAKHTFFGNQHGKKPDLGGESHLHSKVLVKDLNAQQKGKVAEAAVFLRLMCRGHSVFSSAFDGDKYDWLVDVKGRILKIQVKKTRTTRHGRPTISLDCSAGRKRHRRYEYGDFDFLVGYDTFTDKAYVFSAEEVKECKRCISVVEEAEEAWWKLEI